MDKPVFKPQIPEHLLKGASDRDRWMYEQLSIQHQQNEWMINLLYIGEDRFHVLESSQRDTEGRVSTLEKFKSTVTAKWTVGAAVFSLIVPAFIGAMLHRWFEKYWK